MTRPVGRSSDTILPGCARSVVALAMTCNAVMLADGAGRPLSGLTPTGYGPAALRSAYSLKTASATRGAGQVVAVIEAHDDPDAASDLAVYRAHYGLPACGTGCLRFVNEEGVAGDYPTGNNQGWAGEESLDLDMVSAICPNCGILVVEADTESDRDLGDAQDTAARLGATEISDSFGSPESPADLAYDTRYYDHPGIAQTAGSGDSGYGVGYPAASPDVTAVGGTSLVRASTARHWTETAWSGTGSGCSTIETKPAWQTDTGCTHRTVADVSAVADPYDGVAAYDTDCSLLNYLQGICWIGWGDLGGTSVGAPIVAGVYALAGNADRLAGPQRAYHYPGALYDVTSGSDGTCTPRYLCTAAPGYDGPTGLGSPHGTGAF